MPTTVTIISPILKNQCCHEYYSYVVDMFQNKRGFHQD